jgi:hypothetical protein
MDDNRTKFLKSYYGYVPSTIAWSGLEEKYQQYIRKAEIAQKIEVIKEENSEINSIKEEKTESRKKVK